MDARAEQENVKRTKLVENMRSICKPTGKTALVTVWRIARARGGLKKVSNGSRLTGHRLLDMLMQDVWSLTAFVNSGHAKAKSALHLLRRSLCIYQRELPITSMKKCAKSTDCGLPLGCTESANVVLIDSETRQLGSP